MAGQLANRYVETSALEPSLPPPAYKLMRVPLPLATLAPVDHGAYAWEAGRRDGEVEPYIAGRAFQTRHAGTL